MAETKLLQLNLRAGRDPLVVDPGRLQADLSARQLLQLSAGSSGPLDATAVTSLSGPARAIVQVLADTGIVLSAGTASAAARTALQSLGQELAGFSARSVAPVLDTLESLASASDDSGAIASARVEAGRLLLGVELKGKFGATAFGDDGNDSLDFSRRSGNVYLNGGAGDDQLQGGSGNDLLVGGAGDDRLVGNGGKDRFIGGSGNDTIEGGEGADQVLGYNLATDGSDQINLGAGMDLVNVSSTGASQIRLTFKSANVGNGTGTGTEADFAQAPDTLRNTVALQAEDGSSQLAGSIGYADDEGTTFVAAAGTSFDVRDTGGAQRGDQFDRATLGTSQDDELDARGEKGNYYVNAGQGNDEIRTGSGNDFLVGGAGADRLFGNDGNDSFIGGAGADTINGGRGADQVVSYNLASDGSDQINLGAGLDVVNVSSTGASQIRLSFKSANVGNGTGTGTEADFGQTPDTLRNTVALQAEDGSGQLAGSIGYADDEGTTFVAAAGTSFDVRDTGGAQRGDQFGMATLGTSLADLLDFSAQGSKHYVNAGQGNDEVSTGSGNDFLVGGAGADRLTGNGGDDSFIGGAGADTLVGGDGADRFIFGADAAGATDTLTGFQLGANGDLIDLRSLGLQGSALQIAAEGSDLILRADLGNNGYDAAEDLTIRLTDLSTAELLLQPQIVLV